MPKMTVVERDYRKIHENSPPSAPAGKSRQRRQGHWLANRHEVDVLRNLNKTVASSVAARQPKLDTAIDAAEMILTLAPKPTAMWR